MVDVVDVRTRSRMMSGIKGKNTRPEIIVRRALFAQGFRFRLHRRDLPGGPDIVLPGRRLAIFVHGCFWHRHEGCRFASVPATRPEFWKAKLDGNVSRDKRNIEALIQLGWRVLVVWECVVRNRDMVSILPDLLKSRVNADYLFHEISGGVKQ